MQVGISQSPWAGIPAAVTPSPLTGESSSKIPDNVSIVAASAGQSPLFSSNGLFIGGASLTSPATMAALIQTDANGNLETDSTSDARPVTKNDPKLANNSSFTEKAAQLYRETNMASSDPASELWSKFTDRDKEMFKAVTGYNLFVGGTGAKIVDDQGNRPPDKDFINAQNLLGDMENQKLIGFPTDKAWFDGRAATLKSEGGADQWPDDYVKNGDQWFAAHPEAGGGSTADMASQWFDAARNAATDQLTNQAELDREKAAKQQAVAAAQASAATLAQASKGYAQAGEIGDPSSAPPPQTSTTA